MTPFSRAVSRVFPVGLAVGIGGVAVFWWAVSTAHDQATLRKLAGILTDEELADFKAALARQPFLFGGRGAALPDTPPPPR